MNSAILKENQGPKQCNGAYKATKNARSKENMLAYFPP